MHGIIFSLLAALLGLTIVCITIPPLIRVVNAKKLFEPLDKRKVHNSIVPTIGGVSIFIGYSMATILASDSYDLTELRYLFPALILMFFIGLKDDLLILPPRKKLAVQVFTAFMLATLGNFRLTSLSGIFGIWQINEITGVLISAFIIVAIINAFNFIDGIDGLASGIGIIISLILGLCFIAMGKYTFSIASLSLTGSLIAFFRYNVFGKKYKLFMGDTGSLIVGTILSVMVLKFIEFAPSSQIPLLAKSPPAFAFGLMVIPAIDLIRIVFIRLWNKKSPFSPDRKHIHHKILKIFKLHLKATLIICTVNIVFLGFTIYLISTGININYMIAIQLFMGLTIAYLPFKIRKIRKIKQIRLKLRTYPD